jgi:hypothetical protein
LIHVRFIFTVSTWIQFRRQIKKIWTLTCLPQGRGPPRLLRGRRLPPWQIHLHNKRKGDKDE